MAIDRSINAWPKEFSYEIDELIEPALCPIRLEAPSETRLLSPGGSQEPKSETGFDHQTAALGGMFRRPGWHTIVNISPNRPFLPP